MRAKKYFLIIICLLVAAIFGAVLCNLKTKNIIKEKRQTKMVYTSLGDSISAGYALPGYKKDGEAVTECFTTKFAKEIKAAKTYNLAVSGARTEDLLKSLEEKSYIKAIKESKVITVSIGSNDCLRPGMRILYGAANVGSEAELLSRLQSIKDNPVQLFFFVEEIANSVKTPEAQEILSKGIEEYKTNFIKIIDRIRELNQSATLIVESFYNPYSDFVYEKDGVKLIDFGESVQKIIDEMNEFLVSNEYYNKKYIVSDISKLKGEDTNVLLDMENKRFSVDPHPNESGHEYIFAKTLSAYKTKKSS